jgi:hypothetical protein
MSSTDTESLSTNNDLDGELPSYIYIIIDTLLPEPFEEVTSESVAGSIRSEDGFS